MCSLELDLQDCYIASSSYHDEARLMCVEKWMHQKSENSPNPTRWKPYTL